MAEDTKRPVPAGWIGSKAEAPVSRRATKGNVGDHRPLGSLPKRTADWDDVDRTKYPTRGDILSAHTELTPVRFHPAELPDPELAYAASMYPQVIPPVQVDSSNVTHSLGESVPVDDPSREAGRKAAYERDFSDNPSVAQGRRYRG